MPIPIAWSQPSRRFAITSSRSRRARSTPNWVSRSCLRGCRPYFFLAAGFAAGAALEAGAATAPFLFDCLPLAAKGGAIFSFAICRARRALRRLALFLCSTPFEAARSSARTASSASASRSDSATRPPVSDFRAFTTSVLTSERTARLRSARLTPARACFLADAVRLATGHHPAGITHELRIIGAHGIRARREAPSGTQRCLHRTNGRPHRRRRHRGGRRRGGSGRAAPGRSAEQSRGRLGQPGQPPHPLLPRPPHQHQAPP